MMVWVLPALWLAASAQCPFDAAGGRVWVVRCHFSVLSYLGAPSADGKSAASAPALQATHQRVRPLLNGGGNSSPHVFLCAASAAPISVDQAAWGADSASGLARRWQFEWRTACEPRAPCLVS